MNFTCTKNNLLEALHIVEHGIGKNIQLPILQNVLLRCEKNRLYCITTDLEIGISTAIFVKTNKEGEYSVPFKPLMAFIQNVPEDTIEFQLTKGALLVKTKSTHVQIKGEESSQFPLLPKIDKKEYTSFNFSSIPQLLSYVVSALSPTTAKPELSGICTIMKDNTTICVASDGFRLAEKIIHSKTPHEEEKTVLLPNRTSQELIRIFGQNDIKGSLEATIDTHQISIEYAPEEGSTTPAFTFISRLIEGDYPDYQQIIPDSWNTTVTLSKTLLFNHIKNAGFFSNKLCEVRMKFSPKENQCTCTTEEYSQGSYMSTIPLKGEGDEQEIMVNYRYVLDALQPIHGDEVIIQIKQKDSPIIFTAPEESYMALIMPLRS